MNGTGDENEETPQSKAADVSDDRAELVASAADPTSDPSSGVVAPISSNPIELSPESFSAPPDNAPPSTIIENAMSRGRAPLSITTIIGIACGVFVVLVGLSLLLFR